MSKIYQMLGFPPRNPAQLPQDESIVVTIVNKPKPRKKSKPAKEKKNEQ